MFTIKQYLHIGWNSRANHSLVFTHLEVSWLKLVHPSCAPAFSLNLSHYWEHGVEIPLDFSWFSPRSRQIHYNLILGVEVAFASRYKFKRCVIMVLGSRNTHAFLWIMEKGDAFFPWLWSIDTINFLPIWSMNLSIEENRKTILLARDRPHICTIFFVGEKTFKN